MAFDLSIVGKESEPQRHSYGWKDTVLYALDAKLDLAAGASRADLLKAMDGHVIGKASHSGIFRQNIDEKAWPWKVALPP